MKEQIEVTKDLLEFMLLRNQKPRKYGTDDLIYMAEADMISIIGKSSGIHASDLALRLGITKSAVSKTVKKLIKKGIIISQVHQSDTRKLHLDLTPKGKVIYNYHRKMDLGLLENIMKALSGCSNEELQAYNKIAKINLKIRDDVIQSVESGENAHTKA